LGLNPFHLLWQPRPEDSVKVAFFSAFTSIDWIPAEKVPKKQPARPAFSTPKWANRLIEDRRVSFV
jgi:hypothetical protein